MRHVLVGYDESVAAHAALAWAKDLARRARLELHVVRAADRSPGAAFASLPLDDAIASWQVLPGEPGRVLLAAAEACGADLLVVGHADHRERGVLHLGSTELQVVHHAHIPVAVVPPSARDTPLAHLALGVDGTDVGGSAVDLCTELAPLLGVGVTAVYASEPVVELVPERDASSWRRHREADVRRWTAPIATAGAPLETVIDRDVTPIPALRRAVIAHRGAAVVAGRHRVERTGGYRVSGLPLSLAGDGAVVILARAAQRDAARSAS